MKTALCVLVAVVFLVPVAWAGQNPGCGIFLDFDASAEDWWDAEASATTISPDSTEVFTVYVGLASGQPQGESFSNLRVMGVAFDIDVQSEGLLFMDVAGVLPGWLIIGDPWSGMVAGGPCAEAPVVYVAQLTFLYLGAPATIVLTEHPEYGRTVWDCSDPYNPGEDEWCIIGHAGVWQEPPSGESGCYPSTPVEPSSWGRLKALYRNDD